MTTVRVPTDKRRHPRAVEAPARVLLVVMALLFLAPVWMMVVGSLKADDVVLVEAGTLGGLFPAEPSMENYRDVFARTAITRFMFNSFLITGAIVASGLVVNSLAGYAFARLRWRGRDLLVGAVLVAMIIPFEAIVVPLFYGVSILGLRDTYTAQIVPFVGDAFSIFLFYTFFIGLPRELEESARLDGAGIWRTFFWVIVPNAGPVFATVTILTFLTRWGSYLWPMMVTIGPDVRPLPVAIATFYTLPPLQWGDIMAFGVMMVAPILAVFLIFQRWFVRGVADSALKG